MQRTSGMVSSSSSAVEAITVVVSIPNPQHQPQHKPPPPPTESITTTNTPNTTTATAVVVTREASLQNHDRCSLISSSVSSVSVSLPPINTQRQRKRRICSHSSNSTRTWNRVVVRIATILLPVILVAVAVVVVSIGTTTTTTTIDAPSETSATTTTTLSSRQRIRQQQQPPQPSNDDSNNDNKSNDWVLRINAGGGEERIDDDNNNHTNNVWVADMYFIGGRTTTSKSSTTSSSSSSTTTVADDTEIVVATDGANNNPTVPEGFVVEGSSSQEMLRIYETSRHGTMWGGNRFRYEIPVRNGMYHLTFHMHLPNDNNVLDGDGRTFDIVLEQNSNYTLRNIDLVNITNQQLLLLQQQQQQPQNDNNNNNDVVVVVQLSMPNVVVRDGMISIEFRPNLDQFPFWALLRRLFRIYSSWSHPPMVSGIVVTLGSTNVPIPPTSNTTITIPPIGGPPVAAPVSFGGGPPTSNTPIRINTGSSSPYIDTNGNTWTADTYSTNGQSLQLFDANDANTTSMVTIRIPPTVAIDRTVLSSIRTGIAFAYSIPVPPGNYDVRLYFIEYSSNNSNSNLTTTTTTNSSSIVVGQRIFDIRLEGITLYENFDILTMSDGLPNTAVVVSKPYEITDGDVSLEFVSSRGSSDRYLPMISAIEIVFLGVHYAHAVTGGPYQAVIQPNTGLATIAVDANPSHTHAPGLQLIEFIWKLVPSVLSTTGTIIGRGELTTLSLPMGEHIVTLSVKDNGGNDSTETTTITVYGADYPDVTTIVPKNGPIFGGNFVTIVGSGFLYPPNATTVQFGTYNITGSRIQIIDSNQIKLRVPSIVIPSLITVSVITPKGPSRTSIYSYESSIPIRFNSAKLMSIEKPLRIKFGPDGKLYISTGSGQIYKITLDDNYNVIDTIVAQVTSTNRFITGLAFDPIDPDPTRIYFVHNYFFHGEWMSTSGNCINAKISTARGANLDVIADIITGLPVADLDHGIMAIEFGDYGELYIGSGSNTNGGIPGPLTSKSLQKDTGLNSAILIAHIYKSGFNGTITYDANDDGNQVGALGSVEVFAPGVRNPFGMVFHSNGNLYVTDNGPNIGYGKMAMGCDGKSIPDAEEEDRLHLIERGKYYGQPNVKRGLNDPRQCVWRTATEPGTTANDYTPPIGRPLSSTTGVIEYQSNHFDGQLRYSIITALYKRGLYRNILSPDGRSVLPESIPPVLLTGDSTLDITQAPDGSMFDTRYLKNDIYYYRPFEFFSPRVPTIYSVFPKRGSLLGGTILTIYGINLWSSSSSSTTKIMMDENECIISSTPSSKKIQCTIPPHQSSTESVTVDIIAIVSNNPNQATLENGYRYITGTPKE